MAKKGRKRAGTKRKSHARAHSTRKRGGRRSHHAFGINPRLFSLRGVAARAKDGLIVLGGQWVAARTAEQVSGRLLPASFKTSSPLAAAAAANLVGAVVASVVADSVVPRMAGLLALGAWSQAWANTLAQTDAGYKLLVGEPNKIAPAAAQIAGYAGGARARVAGYAPDRRRLAGYAQDMNVASMGAAGAGMGF